MRGREQLHVQERHCPANKNCVTVSLSIMAKNKMQETTLRNFSYYDN